MTTERGLPPLVVLATLVSYVALWSAAGPLPLLIPIALLALTSFFYRARLGEGTLRWVLRLALLSIILAFNTSEPETSDVLIGNARARNILGQAAAAEAMIQFWRFRPADPQRGPLAALFFSGLTLLTACNSSAESLRYLSPLYLALTTLAFLASRPRPGSLRPGLFLRVLALLLPLLLGAAGTTILYERRTEIMNLSFRLLGDMFSPESTGMSGNPRLGPTFDLRGSPTRILRVEGYDGGHLRGNAFPDYDAGTWQPSVSERRYSPTGSTTMVQPTARFPTATARVTRLVAANPLVYAPLVATALDLGDASDPSWAATFSAPVRAEAPPPYVYGFTYPTTMPAQEIHQGVLADPPSPAMRTRCTLVPEAIRPTLRAQALRMTAGAKTPAAKIAAVIDALQSHHPYSLRFAPGRGDPVVDFLARDGVGAHCEFFASAAALLLRCLDFPTRYVVGYYAHEEAGSHAVVVRQRDAHAWVEAWVEGTGWVTVEATPPTGLPDQDPLRPELWRRIFEWFQDRWQSLMRALTEMDPARLPLYLGGVFLAGLTLAGAQLLRRRRRGRTPPLLPFGTPPAALAPLARRFESALTRHGIVVPPHQPWAERLAQLPDSPLRERALRFSALYDAVRFGDAMEISALAAALAEVEQAPPALREAASAGKLGPS